MINQLKPLADPQPLALAAVFVIVFALSMLWQTYARDGFEPTTPTAELMSTPQSASPDQSRLSLAGNKSAITGDPSAVESAAINPQPTVPITPLTQQITVDPTEASGPASAIRQMVEPANANDSAAYSDRTPAITFSTRARSSSDAQAPAAIPGNTQAEQQNNAETNANASIETDSAAQTEDIAPVADPDQMAADTLASTQQIDHGEDAELPPQWEIYEQRRQQVCQTMLDNMLRQGKSFYQLTHREQLVMRDTYKCFN